MLDQETIRRQLRLWRQVAPDFHALGQSELAQTEIVRRQLQREGWRDDVEAQGRVLHRLLTEAWESLKPAGSEPTVPTKDWLPYVVLRECFYARKGRTQQDIGDSLGIPDRTFQREITRAVNLLLTALKQSEHGVREQDAHSVAPGTTHSFLSQTIYQVKGLDGSTTSTRRVVLEAHQPLRSVSFRLIQDEPSEAWELSLSEPWRSDGGVIQVGRRVHTEEKKRWFVDFVPDLLPGAQAAFTTVQTVRQPGILTYEEVMARYHAGLLDHLYLQYLFHVTVSTRELDLRIEFPPGYAITLPESGFDVTHGWVQDAVEKTRLQAENAFSIRQVGSPPRTLLALHVLHPRQGYRYHLCWRPPTQASVRALSQPPNHSHGDG